VRCIVIAGTPGVGKTTVSSILARKLNAVHVDLSRLALEKNLTLYYDEERESYVIDEEKLVNEVLKLASVHERLIIDTHYPEILPKDFVDVVIVLRLKPSILEKRLLAKNWPLKKVRENVLAELLSVVTVNAIEKFGAEKVFEIDTSGMSVENVVEKVLEILSNPDKHERGFRVDWLTLLPIDEVAKYSDVNGEV